MNSFDLSRSWFNFSFDNPEKVKPIHSAIFFFAIEHCNRLGNKEKFGFPSQMTMDAIGVKNYRTYGKALNDLEEWGFITFIERSKNQYSANIIKINGVVKNTIARNKALDKATQKHDTKQGQKQVDSIATIDKPLNHKTIKPINHRKEKFEKQVFSLPTDLPKEEVKKFIEYWTEKNPKGRKMKFEKQKTFDPTKRLSTWESNYYDWQKEKSSDKKEKPKSRLDEFLSN